ncbi:hypothetical protein EG830_03120 [bacterium]|nr:hypothetical protein [bacterium]
MPLGEGIQAKTFFASVIDERNIAWFLTDQGIISFDGAKWTLHNKNRKIVSAGLKDMAYDNSSYGPELWIATSQGATVASLPIDARSGATTYYPGNSSIMSENVLAVAIGQKGLRWFGTDKGISAFRERKWLTNNYIRKYPDGTFLDYQITALETSPDGDSLYIGTRGGGVMRVYRDDVDAISGASEYAAWGPILMPSDNIVSIHVASDGTQWIGTDKGVAKHTGYNTLEGWFVITKEDGLADNFVQAINSDTKGNVYFGTRNGLSVFDGETWKSYNTDSGLSGNNILTIAIAKNDVVWIGTDNGITSFREGVFTVYR